jgi:hypothetical protein
MSNAVIYRMVHMGIKSFKLANDAIYRGQFRAHNRGNDPDPPMTSRHKSEQKRAKKFGGCAKLLKPQRGLVAQLDRAPVS